MNLKKTKILLFASVLLLVLVILSEYFFSHKYSLINNAESISNKLANQTEKLNGYLSKFENAINNNKQKKNLFEVFNHYTSELNEENFYISAFKDNKIEYWSDNAFANNNIEQFNFSDKPILFINNAWVYFKIISVKYYKVVGCIVIKKEYPFENKYLKNEFNDFLNIKGNYNISIQPSSSAYKITDTNGKFLFSLISKNNDNVYETNFYILLSIYIIVIAFIFYLLNNYFKKSKVRFEFKVILLILLFIVTRFFMMKYSFPHIFYLLNIFNSSEYASSFIFPSLGDLLIDSILLFIVTYYFFKYFILKIKKYKVFTGFVLLFFTALTTFLNSYIFKTLIIDSTIPFNLYNILEINFSTLIAVLIILLLIASNLLVVYKVIHTLKEYFKYSNLLYFYFGIILFLIVVQMLVSVQYEYFSIIFSLLIFVLFAFEINYFYKKIDYFKIIVIIVTTIYLTIIISYYTNIKLRDNMKVIAIGLSAERDLVAETFFAEIQNKILSDSTILQYANKNIDSRFDLSKYLKDKYFFGFWNKYDLITTMCTNVDNLKISESNEVYNCFYYFKNIIENQSINIPKTNFYFVDNNNGRINYLGILEIKNNNSDSVKSRIFIELYSRLTNQTLGYPDLFLDKKVSESNLDSKFSYAKYKDGILLTRSGTYNYKTYVNIKLKSDFTFKNEKNYINLYYKTGNNTVIILSTYFISFYDYIVMFTYLLTFIFILFLIFIFYKNYDNIIKFNFVNSIKSRILFSFISILILSFLFIFSVTVAYIISKYETKNYENISEKMQSIMIELNNKINNIDSLNSNQSEYVSNILINLSNVFYSDINFYDKEGVLYATSRPEVFIKGFKGSLINPQAYYSVILQHQPEIVLNEDIGNLKYLSAYVPFYSYSGKFLGIINLPYFTKQNNLSNEITSFTTTLINIYLILIIITIIITLLITNGLTRPIILLKRKFSEIELGRTNEPLKYIRNDEIGELVTEYNRMLDELAKSAQLLAKSERETAWREMAKQIAHEIKNPLTPMKLSIQQMMRSYNNKSEGWEEFITKTSKVLIEQIDNLSAIASEFSMFARLPLTNIEEINLIDKVVSVSELYKNSENIKIQLNFNNLKKIYIKSDKEQIVRIFSNLIKNAIQAIPENTIGLINIDVEVKNNIALIKIKDNGIGISEEVKNKLFIPNFTTKTSGMGLGLAMVKNMVEKTNGKIYYESQQNIGSIFYLEFNVVSFE